MGNKRLFGIAMFVWIMLVFAGCTNRSVIDSSGGEQANLPQLEVPVQLPANIAQQVPAVPHNSSGLVAYEVDPASIIDSSNASVVNWYGEDFAQLLPGEPGGIAWAMYGFHIPSTGKFMGINLDMDDGDYTDEDWDPQYPYFVGFANYQAMSWEWRGPYTSFMAQPEIDRNLPKETYLNASGDVAWVVVSYCPSDEIPAISSILYMDCNFNMN